MSRRIAAALLASLAVSTAAEADPPASPLSGIDFVASRAFVGDLALGIEPGDPGVLLEVAADTPDAMASVTKSFTLLMAVEAIDRGDVSLDDVVTVSQHAATIDNGHAGSGHSDAGLFTNQQITLEDLLYGVIHPSGGDASMAVGETIALAVDPNLAKESGAARHAAFVGMMNDRKNDMQLDDTLFFNSYGGDHFHFDDNTPGLEVDHHTTARDIARWFAVGVEYPLFREIAGFNGTYQPFGWSSPSFYPGTVAQKPGGNGSCTSCRGVVSRRVGRELVTSFMDGVGGSAGDHVTLLDYGFAATFHPTQEAESAPYTGGWMQSDLACVGEDAAVSAVARPNGDLGLLLWGHDFTSQSITHLNPVRTVWQPEDEVAPTRGEGDDVDQLSASIYTAPPLPETLDLTSGTESDDDGMVELTSTSEAERTSEPAPSRPLDESAGGSEPVVLAARVADFGGGRLAVLTETDQGIWLWSYAISPTNSIFVVDSHFLGDGDLGRLATYGSELVVTAHRTPSGQLELNSFDLDPLSGLFSDPLDTFVTSAATSLGSELELSGHTGGPLQYPILVASTTAGGAYQIRSFSLHRYSGALTGVDNITSVGTPAVQVSVSRLRGYGLRWVYAVSSFDGNGQLRVEAYEIDGSHNLTLQGSTIDTMSPAVDADARLRMAAYDEGGVMIVVQPDADLPSQRLETWSFDPNAWSATATVDLGALVPRRIASETTAQADLQGVCRTHGDAAEGDFLVATGEPGVDGLRLVGWRSAAR